MGICSYTCVEQIRKFVSDAEPSGFKVVMDDSNDFGKLHFSVVVRYDYFLRIEPDGVNARFEFLFMENLNRGRTYINVRDVIKTLMQSVDCHNSLVHCYTYSEICSGTSDFIKTEIEQLAQTLIEKTNGFIIEYKNTKEYKQQVYEAFSEFITRSLENFSFEEICKVLSRQDITSLISSVYDDYEVKSIMGK